MTRFEVTELEGYTGRWGSGQRSHLSTHVVDVPWNRRVVATFRTENHELNAAHSREAVMSADGSES